MSAPIGFYVTDEEAQCIECHEPSEWGGFEEWDAPLPILEGTVGDAPTHCADCGGLISHGLTDVGLDHVAEALDRRDGRPDILDKWARTYGPRLTNVGSGPPAAALSSGSNTDVRQAAANMLDRLDRLHRGPEVGSLQPPEL